MDEISLSQSPESFPCGFLGSSRPPGPRDLMHAEHPNAARQNSEDLKVAFREFSFHSLRSNVVLASDGPTWRSCFQERDTLEPEKSEKAETGGTPRFYKEGPQEPFWPGPHPENHGAGPSNINDGSVGISPLASIADFAPLRLRPLAYAVLESLETVPWSKMLILVLAVLFAVRELVEIRRDWYGGTSANEQAVLAQIQQQRERAEIVVAGTTARKNIQEELTSLTERESNFLRALKTDLNFPGANEAYALLAQDRLTIPLVLRYREQYDMAQRSLADCGRTQRCSDIEVRALAARVDTYRMLMENASAVARLEVELVSDDTRTNGGERRAGNTR